MARLPVVCAVISAAVSATVTMVVLGWFVYTTPAGAQVSRVEAGEFRLLGSDGTLRFVVEETRFGGSSLRVVQNEVNRAVIVSGNRDAESSGVNLNDTAGQRRIWIALKQGETSGATGNLNGLAVLDSQQRIRVHLGVDDDSSTPFLRLLDENGTVVWAAPVH